MKIINLGEPDELPPVDWAAVVDKLESGWAPAPDAMNSRTTWLCTVNEDGCPHVTAVGAVWLDGAFFVPDRGRHAEGTQCGAQSKVFDRAIDSGCGRRGRR